MPIIRYLFKANLREETPVVVGGREDVKMVLPGGKETIIFSVKIALQLWSDYFLNSKCIVCMA